jgi:hypothetical protein
MLSNHRNVGHDAANAPATSGAAGPLPRSHRSSLYFVRSLIFFTTEIPGHSHSKQLVLRLFQKAPVSS